MSKRAFEVFIGIRMVVTIDSDEAGAVASKPVEAAARDIAKAAKMIPAREVIVREVSSDQADGKWVLQDGAITRIAQPVKTYRDLVMLEAESDDVATIEEAGGALYMFSPQKEPPAGYKGKMLRSKHGGIWLLMQDVANAMMAEQAAAGSKGQDHD